MSEIKLPEGLIPVVDRVNFCESRAASNVVFLLDHGFNLNNSLIQERFASVIDAIDDALYVYGEIVAALEPTALLVTSNDNGRTLHVVETDLNML